MNRSISLLMILLAATISFTACKKDTLGDKIDDAMDNRPAEKLQDKAEDVKDKVKDATN